MKPKRNRIYAAWAIILFWVVALSGFLFWWRFSYFGVFDPRSEWLDNAPETVPIQGRVMLHIRDDCLCNRFADAHLKLLSEASDHEQRTLDVSAAQALGIPVPAVPMLVVVEDQQVIYAGPYATGPTCAVDESVLPDILNHQQNLMGAWYFGNAQACRCVL